MARRALHLRSRPRHPRAPWAHAFVLLASANAARAQLEQQQRIVAEPPPPAPPPTLHKGPELLAPVDAPYPEDARSAGRTGDVVLRIVIDEQGVPERVDVLQSARADDLDAAGVALDWAALGAAARFVFAPATFCHTDFIEAPPESSVRWLPKERCGVPGRVVIEYRTTFNIEERTTEVPTEPPPPPTLGVLNYAGIVREAGSKDPLEAVVVEVETAGGEVKTTTTDAQGRFEMRAVPAGDWRVSFTLSSYEPAFVDETFRDKERTETVVYLTPVDVNKFETVVRRQRAHKEVSKIALSRDEVRKVPGTFGDPLRVIENLPGLARAPFIGGALIVRGANPEDSGVYFDGVEMPLLYHFGGLTSVVNAEFLEDISFYPGGFGAYYGRATAGIVDVASRELELKTYRGYAEVDLIDSGFFFGGPLKIGDLPQLNFAFAARRSYIDGVLPVVLDAFIGPGGQGIIAAPVYWDYQAKVEASPIPDHSLSLFMFGSDDDLKVLQRGVGGALGLDIGFHTTFHRMVGRWDWRLARGLRHRAQPFVGFTRVTFEANNSGDAGGPDVGFGLGIDTYNWGLRDELEMGIVDGVVVRAGLDYLGQTFGARFDVPLPIEIGSFPRVFPRIEGSNQQFGSQGLQNATAVYAEAEISPWPNVTIVPGVRAELTIFTFLPDTLVDGETSDAAEADVFHIDPRLVARFELWPKTTLKGAFGVYRRAGDGAQLNPDTGNPNLLEPRAVQLIAGLEQGLTSQVNLDVQLYWTNRDLLIQGTDDTRSRGGGEADPLFFNNGGRGRTVGAELLVRHEISEHFYGWIAYTLSRTDIDLDENDNAYALTDFDQTHILTVVAQTNLPWGMSLGGRFRAVTGNPTNLPLGSVHDVDTTSYSSLGTSSQSARLPAFHQLDLRVDKKFVFDTFALTAYLDLLNIYNQQNAEGFLSDYRNREQAPIPSLPILPVIGMSGEF
jgi:TonB family protein